MTPVLLGAFAFALFGAAHTQGADSLITFETFPDGSTVPYRSASLSNQWANLGVLISDSTAIGAASGYDGVAGEQPHSGTHGISVSSDAPGGYVVFSFVAPGTAEPGVVNHVGIWVENNDTAPSVISFFGREKSVLHSVVTHGHDVFVSYSNAVGIFAVMLDDPDYFLADDLQFGPVVPQLNAWPGPDGAIVFSWSSAYTNYVLQWSVTTFESTNWSNVATQHVPSNQQYFFTNATSGGARFFRLMQQ